MNDKVYNIIDYIEKSDIKLKLDEIKNKISNDKSILELIENFNKSKELYERYGYEKELIESKIKLMKEPLIKSYLEIQNEINLLSIFINNKIKEIINNTTCNK